MGGEHFIFAHFAQKQRYKSLEASYALTSKTSRQLNGIEAITQEHCISRKIGKNKISVTPALCKIKNNVLCRELHLYSTN